MGGILAERVGRNRLSRVRDAIGLVDNWKTLTDVSLPRDGRHWGHIKTQLLKRFLEQILP